MVMLKLDMSKNGCVVRRLVATITDEVKISFAALILFLMMTMIMMRYMPAMRRKGRRRKKNCCCFQGFR